VEFSTYMSSTKDFSCNIKIIDRKIDLCRIGDSLSSNPLLSLALKSIEKSLNFKLSCPIDPQPLVLKYF
jgi:hypothetical protein